METIALIAFNKGKKELILYIHIYIDQFSTQAVVSEEHLPPRIRIPLVESPQEYSITSGINICRQCLTEQSTAGR